jgi:hypothetical protein
MLIMLALWPLKLNRLEDDVEVSLAICGPVYVCVWLKGDVKYEGRAAKVADPRR